MDIRLRLLTAEIAILTAVASLFATNTEEWTKVYERRLYVEMALNLWRSGNEQKTSEKRDTGMEPVPAWDEKTVDSAFIHKEYIKGTSKDDTAFSENVYCEAKMAADLQGYEPESRETYEALNEQTTGEEAGIPSMAPICEEMVEAEDPRTPLAAEAESYSQPLAQNAESEAVNEQTAEEEILEYSIPEALENVQPAVVQDPVEVVQQIAPVAPDQRSYVCSVSCAGDCLDAGVSEYLKRRLTEAGIGWFFPYACCIAYQESSFNPLAENTNGRDKGLFQYRVEFHPELDWRNPYQQVDIFTAQMTARANAGCDVYTMISRHLMSDYGEYNADYVTRVLSHLGRMKFYE